VVSSMIQSTEYAPGTISSEAYLSTRKFDYQNFRTSWYKHMFKQQEPEIELRVLGQNSQVTPEDVAKICIDYMTGMSWTLSYYLKSDVGINLMWFYPRYYPPLLSDLAYVSRTPLLKQYQPTPGDQLINPVHQLMAVIPPSSYQVLPEELRHLVNPATSGSSAIGDLYPIDCKLDLEVDSSVEEAPLLVPFPDINRIIAIADRLRFAPNRLALWNAVGKYIIQARVVATVAQPISGRTTSRLLNQPGPGRAVGGRGRYVPRGTERGRFRGRAPRRPISSAATRGGRVTRVYNPTVRQELRQ